MFPSVELLCFIGREGYNCFSHAYLVSIQSRTNRFLHSVSVAVTICGTRFEVSGQQTPSARKLLYHANIIWVLRINL